MKSLILFSTSFIYFSLFTARLAKADSPLTESFFAAIYQREEIITYTKSCDGKLDSKLMYFLTDEPAPLSLKLAVINQLGWNIKGNRNSIRFINFLLSKGYFKSETEILKNGSGELLICLAYLQAMGNYFSVAEAYKIAKLALIKSPNSLAVSTISSLIKAQVLFIEKDLCGSYMSTNTVYRSLSSYNEDFPFEALQLIENYMCSYRSYCKQTE